MIVGFVIKSITAERKNPAKGRIDINSTPRILSIIKSKDGFMKKENPLNIEFEFVTRYEPNVGIIRISGNMLYVGKKIKDTLKDWEKNGKVPKEVEIEVKNFLFRKCLTIGVNLSENMQLPPPLIFPRVMSKPTKLVSKSEQDLSYIG